MPFVYYICFYIIAKTFILTEIFRQETKMSIAPKHDYWREIILLSEPGNDSCWTLDPEGGKGGTPGISWWGCAARVFKSWPNFRPKNVIFHIRFKWWELGLKKGLLLIDCFAKLLQWFPVMAFAMNSCLLSCEDSAAIVTLERLRSWAAY